MILFCLRDLPHCSFNPCVVLTSHVKMAEEKFTSIMEVTPCIEMAQETSTNVMEATELRGHTATFYG